MTSAKLCATSTSTISSSPPIAGLAVRAPIAWLLFTRAQRRLRERTSSAGSMACRKPTCLAQIRSWSRIWCRLPSRRLAATAWQTIRRLRPSTPDSNRRLLATLRHSPRKPALFGISARATMIGWPQSAPSQASRRLSALVRRTREQSRGGSVGSEAGVEVALTSAQALPTFGVDRDT